MLAANRLFYSLKKSVHLKEPVATDEAGTIYSTYIVPVLTYGSETWALPISDETLLAAFEREDAQKLYV